MHPRPLHRWKSFWLGLLVLNFLGWAWVRSMSHHEGIRWFHGDWGAMVGQGSDGVAIYVGDRPSALSEGLYIWNGPDHKRAAKRFGRPFHFSPWLGVQIHGHPVLASKLLLAHWFLILLFLVPWAGFLFWRVRRMSRVGKAPTSVNR
jgi:hypothetical protein